MDTNYEVATETLDRAKTTLQLLQVALANTTPAIRESLQSVLVDMNDASELLHNVGLDTGLEDHPAMAA